MKCEISRGTAQNGNEILGDCTECRKLIFNISTQERPYIMKYWLVMKYRLITTKSLKTQKKIINIYQVSKLFQRQDKLLKSLCSKLKTRHLDHEFNVYASKKTTLAKFWKSEGKTCHERCDCFE